MAKRAALVTGASRGIGRLISSLLVEQGFDLTVVARNADALQSTAEELRAEGARVAAHAGNLADEQTIVDAVATHRREFGRLDVLVNNAGVGIGAAASDNQTKKIDLQLDVNLRALILFYREAIDMLKAAGQDHGGSLVINLASAAGKHGQPWLSVYSATKAGMISYTEAMNAELGPAGVRSIVLCPDYVDTEMSDFIKSEIPPNEMIRPEDVVEAVAFLLRLSPYCLVPEIVFQRRAGV